MINPDNFIEEEETPITSLSKYELRWLILLSTGFFWSIVIFIIHKIVC